MASEYVLFDGKNLSELFKDIYTNQVTKRKSISQLIETLRSLITNSGDAALIAPIVKDLIEVSVKNDDQLVKLATIAQRLHIAATKEIGEDGYLSATEKKQVLTELKAEINEVASFNDAKLDNIQDEIDDIVLKTKK